MSSHQANFARIGYGEFCVCTDVAVVGTAAGSLTRLGSFVRSSATALLPRSGLAISELK